MSTLAKILFEGVGGCLLAVFAAVRSAGNDLAFAGRMLAFLFFRHRKIISNQIQHEELERTITW
jgi:hypothetical protein